MTTLQSLGTGEAVIAFDVGGTDVKAALVDRSGSIVGLCRTPTAHDADHPARALVDGIAEVAVRLRAAHPELVPAAAGLSVPGLVDETHGIGIFSSNLGWRDAPLHAMARSALGLPTAFAHDVRSAGEAELRLGAARGCRDAILVTIGTGIASTLVIDGKVYSGGGYAGELGHTLVDPQGAPCACGGVGCLETVASAAAIARRFRERGGDAEGAREVLAAAEAGDRTALAVWDEAVTALAEQLSRVVTVLAPTTVVIGGGLSEAGPALFDPLAAKLESLLSFQRRPELVRAELGGDAGLYGTALAARDLASGRRGELPT